MKSSLHAATPSTSSITARHSQAQFTAAQIIPTQNKARTSLTVFVTATCLLLALSTLTTAQFYQVQPDGSLRYVPQLTNPANPANPTNLANSVNSANSGTPVTKDLQPLSRPQPIRSGQIINGERVISILPTRPLEFSSSQSPATKSGPANSTNSQAWTNSQATVRPDKIPPTVFPIAPENTASDSSPVLLQTQQNPKSSVTEEEKPTPAKPADPQSETLAQPQSETLTQPLTKIFTQQSELLAPPLQADAPQTKGSAETSDTASDLVQAKAIAITQENLKTNNDPSSNSAAPITSSPIDEDVMAEIRAIRQQIGGGISGTLSGVAEMPKIGSIEITPGDLSTDSTADRNIATEELFSQQLRSVISEQGNENPLASDEATASPESNFPNTASNSANHSGLAARVTELRACARELEQLAGRLETIDAYQAADNLRHQANDLWMKARQR